MVICRDSYSNIRKTYLTRESAENAQARTNSNAIRAYRCPECGNWHLGRPNSFMPAPDPLVDDNTSASPLDAFEAFCDRQRTRIENTLALVSVRLRQARMEALDNGPLIDRETHASTTCGDDSNIIHRGTFTNF